MNVAAFLVPPSLDPKQATRLRRLGVASLTYGITSLFVGLACVVGMLPAAAALQIAAAYVVINIAFYTAFRSGFNLRFADPSLTRFQILVGITMVMYIVYNMDDGRELGLFGCFLVFLFGIFRLTAREFVAITLYTLMGYALVIALLMRLRPWTITEPSHDLVGWLLLAGFLPCFNIIAGQFNALRRRLRESEGRFRSLTEMSSDFYWESDAQHRLTLRSSASPEWNANSVTPFRQGTQIGQCRWDVPSLSPDEAGWRIHRAMLDNHEPFRRFVYSRVGKDGAERHVSLSGDPIFDSAGLFTGYRGVGRDVSRRRRNEKAQREATEKLRVFADNIPVMTASWDENLRCRFANLRFTEVFALRPDDVLGKHLREIFGEKVYAEVEPHFIEVLKGYPVAYEGLRAGLGGEARWYEVKLVPNIDEHGKVVGCFSVSSDVTQHKLTAKRIQHVAHHDSLTDLPNRLLFNDRLDQLVKLSARSGAPFALLYIDLNKFKPVNDTFGHAAGDKMLVAVGARLRRELRASDTVARIGGDEFAVLLPQIGGRADAGLVCAKITAALAEPVALGAGRSAGIGSSIGIAMFPADAADAQALMKAADAAMYDAKQMGPRPTQSTERALDLPAVDAYQPVTHGI